jgi:hypothetical protein
MRALLAIDRGGIRGINCGRCLGMLRMAGQKCTALHVKDVLASTNTYCKTSVH